MNILITGSAGFIGYFLTRKLLERGENVVGLDNINEYYDPNLKYARLAENGIYRHSIERNVIVRSNKYPNYRFIKLNLEDKPDILHLFSKEKFDMVVHLAAQAGVRYSINHPEVCVQSNVVGFLNILEACRQYPVQHLVYASSSSVYGLNEQMPFSVDQSIAHPISLYAATKKSNELMAHVYSYLFNIPTTGLRFFTVYGPWGRPDMAYFLFANAIMKEQPITVYNGGQMNRDFTYVDDIVEGIVRVLDKPATPDPQWNAVQANPSSSMAPYRIYNIGNDNPVALMDLVMEIERNCEKKAIIEMKTGEKCEVQTTWADISSLATNFNYKPTTSIQAGIETFIKWHKEFYAMEHLEFAHA
ncbi:MULTISPECIES: NAD-dependent epimerase [Niastella]|uniref:NAD-dependent epimerase n=1 Tax=Niastella soli TaxID=2821487 RepID=A0ABS3YTI1_9BACT|nr:NAD-dependent epimerase [Niastella soli]MBO9200516.1 NAD-dependent epimerase [Niastella soli]